MSIGDTLQTFSFDILQSSVTVYSHLDKHNYTIDDLTVYVKNLQEEKIKRIEKLEGDRIKNQDEYRRIAPKCPNDGLPLMLHSIHIPQGKANKNGYKSLLYCNDEDCLYEKYSRKPADYLYRQMIRKGGK